MNVNTRLYNDAQGGSLAGRHLVYFNVTLNREALLNVVPFELRRQ